MSQKKYRFFTRELSWLSFNERVLNESLAEGLSTHDQLKFLAIYASNLNEFLKVRIPGIRALAERGKDISFVLQMQDVNQEINRQQKRFFTIFERDVQPKLIAEGRGILKIHNYTDEVVAFAEEYLRTHLSALLNPVVMMTKKSSLPFIQDGDMYMATLLFVENKKGELKKKHHLAFVNVPIKELGRFVPFTSSRGKRHILLLEDLIRVHLDRIFPGYITKGAHAFSLLRNADYEIADEYSGDLVKKIKEAIDARETGVPCRFLYEGSMPMKLLLALQRGLSISPDDLEISYGYLRFSDFMDYPQTDSEQLQESYVNSVFDTKGSYLKQIEACDYLLHFPYHSYEHVLRFLSEAAIASAVTEIKITQYRVARNSAVVNALINAANNGKRVTVFVEAKARFDEQQNLSFAHEMKEAGIHVIYSMPKVKVHAKVILIKTKDKEHVGKSYAYISTGNFNEKTARLYTDHGLFTFDERITSDISRLFDIMEKPTLGKSSPCSHLICSPWDTRDVILKHVEGEIESARRGERGHIVMKMNGLQDETIIRKLYEASEAGVVIELIVRGICCLVPDQSYSKNIKLVRLIDKYLEHGRIYWFYNQGKESLYIGSADLMQRNLDRRIEVLTPVREPRHKAELYDMLQIFLRDNVKACRIDSNLHNIPVDAGSDAEPVRAQDYIWAWLDERYGEK